MSDQDDFERRLGAALKVFAVGGDRPFDASQLASSALRTRNDGWLTRQFKRPAQESHILATAAIVVIVAAASFAIGLYAGRPSSNIAGPRSTDTPLLTPSPSTPTTSAEMWPQANLDEVREAQDRADAGDPAYTWQVDWDLGDPGHIGQHHPGDAKIFPGFLEQVLGWEAFLDGHHVPRQDMAGLDDGEFVYIRCAPGGTNPLYPTDPEGAGCAPTIDELRYETVKIKVAQPDQKGLFGIWVVTGWEMIGPARQSDSRVDEAEASALVEAFLQARIDGDGAEELADFPEGDAIFNQWLDRETPLLYATTSGAPYERSEFELVDGPTWPEGRMQFEARLFAENDETVVEQRFSLDRDDTGRMGLGYGIERATTENGKAVPVEYSFLDGEVTYRATDPLAPSQDGYEDGDRVGIDGLLPDDDNPRRVLLMLADPRPIGPGCAEGPASEDAEALARSIGSDPDFKATAPVAATIGGGPALQMDVVLAPEARNCIWSESDEVSPLLLKNAPFERYDRARLYLVDLPAGLKARVLVLATISDEDSLETVADAAAPILDSIEFHAP